MKDLSIILDNSKLNIRVGVIFKYQDEILIELSKVGSNSVIPGGRVKILEKTIDALIREIKEEMNINLIKEKLSFFKVYENFFQDKLNVHELFFVYQYEVNKNDYDILSKVSDNQDNNNSYFKFIKINELDNINLLPETLLNDIKTLEI